MKKIVVLTMGLILLSSTSVLTAEMQFLGTAPRDTRGREKAEWELKLRQQRLKEREAERELRERQQRIQREKQYRWNHFEKKWEIASPQEKLQWNSIEQRWEYSLPYEE